jgi:hypothetical protein
MTKLTRRAAFLAAGLFGILASALPAQVVSQATRDRIALLPAPVNRDVARWSEWESALDGDFPWVPRNFWQGFIKTTASGKKAGIFVAFFTPMHKLKPGELGQTVPEGFSDAGAELVSENNFTLSGYSGEEMVFASPGGNGLFFTDPNRGVATSASFIYLEMEKEKDRGVYPFLAFFFAAPTVDFPDVKPEFDAYVQGTIIRKLPASLSGRVVSGLVPTGIPNVPVEVWLQTGGKRSLLTDTAGSYRFDSLPDGFHYLVLTPVTGYRALGETQRRIELKSGEDQPVPDFQLETVEQPRTEPTPKPKPKKTETEVADTPVWPGLGVGFRYRSDGVSELALAARVGRFVPEATFGCDIVSAAWRKDVRFAATLGTTWYLLNHERSRLGIGLFGSGRWLNDTHTEYALALPLSAEYRLTGELVIQAGIGPCLAWTADTTRFSIGNGRLTGGLGLTYYFR